MRRVVSLVGLVVVALIAAVCFWPDSAAPDDSDLMPKPSAAGEAAFPDFQALGGSVAASDEERAFITAQSSGGITDVRRVQALLARNEAALELFARFAAHPTFADPAFRDLTKVNFKTPVPLLHPVATAARLSGLRSELLLARGETEEALQDAFRAHDAGRMLMSSGSQLMEFLVGALILEDAVNRVRAAALAPNSSRAGRLEAARRLGAPTRSAASLQEALRYEYVTAAWTAEHLVEMSDRDASFEKGPALLARAGLLYNPKATRALFAERYRLLVAEAGKPCGAASVPPLERPSLVPRPNLVGIIIFHVGIPDFAKIYARRCASDAAAASAAVDIAVESYRRDHGGAPPSSLAELLPEYLDAVPPDPHTGEPLAYAAKVY